MNTWYTQLWILTHLEIHVKPPQSWVKTVPLPQKTLSCSPFAVTLPLPSLTISRTHLFVLCHNSCLCECHINRIIQHVIFWGGLLWFSIMSLRVISVTICINSLFLFPELYFIVYTYCISFIYLFTIEGYMSCF